MVALLLVAVATATAARGQATDAPMTHPAIPVPLSWQNEPMATTLGGEHRPTLVSVVTNGTSDDVNHLELGMDGVYLRIAGLGARVFALHYS